MAGSRQRQTSRAQLLQHRVPRRRATSRGYHHLWQRTARRLPHTSLCRSGLHDRKARRDGGMPGRRQPARPRGQLKYLAYVRQHNLYVATADGRTWPSPPTAATTWCMAKPCTATSSASQRAPSGVPTDNSWLSTAWTKAWCPTIRRWTSRHALPPRIPTNTRWQEKPCTKSRWAYSARFGQNRVAASRRPD